MTLFGFTLSRHPHPTTTTVVATPAVSHSDIASTAAPDHVKAAGSAIVSGLRWAVENVEAHPEVLALAAKIVATTAKDPQVVKAAVTIAGAL